MLTLHPSVAAKNTQELIALAKAKPGSLNYGTPGIGSLTHRSTELFDLMAGEGLEAFAADPEAFREVLQRDIAKWSKVVKAANIKPIQ